MYRFICLLLLTTSLFSCGSDTTDEKEEAPDPTVETCTSSPKNKGTRLLGIDLLDTNETSSFDANLQKAQEFGYEFIALHLLWSSIEVGNETYEDPGSALTLLNDVVANNNLKFSLTIRPIDLTGKTVPSDLETTRFNTSEMIDRFKSLIDFVFTKMSYERLTSIQIGNEIDGYDTSQEHPDFWSDYGTFLFEINKYVDDKYPGLQVGFTGTFHGMVKGNLSNSSVFSALASAVDVLGVTYYPINSDFSVMAPEVITNDLNDLISAFPGQKIYLQEVGYQTSATNNSTEAKQAQFVCNFFTAWDLHSEAIQLVNWVRLNDVSPSDAQNLAGPYGINGPEFTEYLRTLGLRTHDGAGMDKMAFNVLVEEATKRGW